MKDHGLKIWTEEEDEDRQIKNMINHEGKNCKNCYWSGYQKGEEFITCGHHYENFKPISFCSYWTDPKDSSLLSYKESRKRELKLKLNRKCKQKLKEL